MKHRLYYTVYLLIALWIAVTLPGKYSIALLITLLILPFLSGGIVYIASRNLRIIQALSEDQTVKEQTVGYTLKLRNDRPLFIPHLEIKHFINPAFSYSNLYTESFPLLPRSQNLEECSIDCLLRGRYAVGCKTVEVWDYLKIFKFKKEIAEPLFIVIHPKLKPIRNLNTSPIETQQESPVYHPQEEDYTTVADFREYDEQDSIKKVHWKLSAKKEELIVKKYASYSSTGTAVALNLCPIPDNPEDAPVTEDRMIELAVSMVHYIVRRGESLDFLYNTNSPEKLHVENINQFHQLYSISALLKFGSPVPFEKLLENYLYTNPGSLNLFILTAALTPALCEQVLRMKAGGYAVTVVDFSPLPASDSEKSAVYTRLHERGVVPIDADAFISAL